MTRFDVIIAGAGPSGAVAAAALASRGLRVALCDRAAFPRDKTCGDALIADSLAVLGRLGLADAVTSRAASSCALRVMSAGGWTADIPGTLQVLPRRTLDELLVAHAVRCGAALMQVSVDAPIVDADAVTGVTGKTGAGAAVRMHAPLTILATGASGAALRAFD
ncbi:MAG: FAD-dependent monooxygenase, partial [Acidobacteriota bacterium]|nr:FAD-dependent monooxygenase [Acidobacteriota bacterium]